MVVGFGICVFTFIVGVYCGLVCDLCVGCGTCGVCGLIYIWWFGLVVLRMLGELVVWWLLFWCWIFFFWRLYCVVCWLVACGLVLVSMRGWFGDYCVELDLVTWLHLLLWVVLRLGFVGCCWFRGWL